MDLIKLLWSSSPGSALIILTLSGISGIAGGFLLILFADASFNIHTEGQYVFYALSLPLLTAIFLVFRHLAQQKTEALAGKAVEKMVLSVTNTVRHAELPEFERLNQSDILMSITDAQNISNGACKNVEFLQAYLMLFISWLYIYIYISPFIGLLLLLSRLLILLTYKIFMKVIISNSYEQIKQEKEIFTAFQNHLYGFKELKFNHEKSEDLFNNYLANKIESNKETRIKTKRYGSELGLICLLITILTLVCCTTFKISLSNTDVLKIVIIFLYSLQIDMIIGDSMQHIALGKAALKQLRSLFTEDTLKDSDDYIKPPMRKNINEFDYISFNDVMFSYPDQNNGQIFQVHVDNLTIKSGDILFVVGGNGSGKSTFMNILTGLYPPVAGTVNIDEDRAAMKDYRHMFSAVFTDFHLFDRFYGFQEVDEKKVSELLKLTDLKGKTGYDGEKFTTLDLSTGQKKRLALVIALMEDRPIFVFDEWAADQDPHFRRYFYENILPSLKQRGKSVIAITHDDRFFHIADTIVRLEYGSIAEIWRPEKEKAKSGQKVFPFISEKPDSFSPHKKMQGPEEDTFFEKEKYAGDKYKGKSMLKQFRQIFSEERDAIKKMFFMVPIYTLSLVSLFVILIHRAQQEQVPEVQHIWFILLLIMMVVSLRLFQNTYNRAVENRIADLRVNVMEHVRKTDLLTLKKIGVGRIYSTLTSDIQAVASTSGAILFCIQGSIRTVMIYFYISCLYFPAFLMMLFLTGAGAGFYFYNHLKAIKLFEQLRDSEKKMFEAVTHLLEGFKELKLCNKKSNDFYRTEIMNQMSGLRKLKLNSVRYYTYNATITYGFWKGILIIMILIMPFFGFPQNLLPIATGLVLTLPLRQVTDHYSQFHMAFMSIQRLFKFENRIKNMGQETAGEPLFTSTESYNSISYDNISFTYQTKDSRPFSVGPMDISFKAGEIVFITGGNGSGKSTLINVVIGLFKADPDHIFKYNGNDAEISRYRELFGPIFSDFHLFDRLYGMEAIDESKLNALLRRFGLDKRVQWVDEKFSTLDLSTGQKKRLALIVTMMEDKPVYVFDEWAADQDLHFREYFYMTLLPEFKAQGKTVIAVTHDDRYFHFADRVLHLEYGTFASERTV